MKMKKMLTFVLVSMLFMSGCAAKTTRFSLHEAIENPSKYERYGDAEFASDLDLEATARCVVNGGNPILEVTIKTNKIRFVECKYGFQPVEIL